MALMKNKFFFGIHPSLLFYSTLVLYSVQGNRREKSGKPPGNNDIECNNGGITEYIMWATVVMKETVDVRKGGELITITAIENSHSIYLIYICASLCPKHLLCINICNHYSNAVT